MKYEEFRKTREEKSEEKDQKEELEKRQIYNERIGDTKAFFFFSP